MYTEEPKRSIDWGTVLKKGLIILLIAIIIFLIIWLFTRNNSNGITVDYNGNSNTTETDNPVESETYSEIFIDNYRYFHDTAKEYFLISELPEKGNTIKYTLQELIDKNLILQFGYTGTENCDTESSYVIVKNNDGKYTLNTTLVCGLEVATTTEELGCNQICVDKIDCDCNCDTKTEEETPTEKVTQYQYKQAYTDVETTYSCPSGYTKTGSGSNTKCVKTDSSTTKVTKTTNYICKDGYEKVGSGENTKCVKENEKIVNAEKKQLIVVLLVIQKLVLALILNVIKIQKIKKKLIIIILIVVLLVTKRLVLVQVLNVINIVKTKNLQTTIILIVVLLVMIKLVLVLILNVLEKQFLHLMLHLQQHIVVQTVVL